MAILPWSAISPISSSARSTATSTRLTKKEATDATWLTSPPSVASFSSPAMVASATASYWAREKISVTLTLIPSPMSVLMAGTPAGVAGTLIITLGRSSVAKSRRASSTVPSVSWASVGLTSRLT